MASSVHRHDLIRLVASFSFLGRLESTHPIHYVESKRDPCLEKIIRAFCFVSIFIQDSCLPAERRWPLDDTERNPVGSYPFFVVLHGLKRFPSKLLPSELFFDAVQCGSRPSEWVALSRSLKRVLHVLRHDFAWRTRTSVVVDVIPCPLDEIVRLPQEEPSHTSCPTSHEGQTNLSEVRDLERADHPDPPRGLGKLLPCSQFPVPRFDAPSVSAINHPVLACPGTDSCRIVDVYADFEGHSESNVRADQAWSTCLGYALAARIHLSGSSFPVLGNTSAGQQIEQDLCGISRDVLDELDLFSTANGPYPYFNFVLCSGCRSELRLLYTSFGSCLSRSKACSSRDARRIASFYTGEETFDISTAEEVAFNQRAFFLSSIVTHGSPNEASRALGYATKKTMLGDVLDVLISNLDVLERLLLRLRWSEAYKRTIEGLRVLSGPVSLDTQSTGDVGDEEATSNAT